MNEQPVVIFTGGHHTSSLEVARRLSNSGRKVIWIGHKYSMWKDTAVSAEYREVTAAGIEFIELKAGKVHRTFHPLKLIRVPCGFITAFRILLQLKRIYGRRLSGIVSFGGYLGVPVVFAGWLLGLPTIAHEQTATAGLANKFIACFAKKIAVTWPSSLKVYPESKTVVVGLPLRSEIVSALKKTRPDKNLIYITGGKQGSHIINENVFPIIKTLLADHRIIHQTGSSSIFNDFSAAGKLRDNLPENLKSKYQIYEYLDAGLAARTLASAGIVVGRSGAHIVYEIGLFGCKSVLIPIPWASHSEQYKNAQILADSGQAVILNQADLSPDTLISAIKSAEKLNPVKLNLSIDGLEKMVQLIERELFKV